MKKVNVNYLFYILGVIGIVGALLTYNMYFMPNKEKVTQLEAQTKTLNTKINELKVISAASDEYEQKMVDMKKEIEELVDSFSPYYQMEDELMFTYNMTTAVDYVDFSTITEYTPELLYNVSNGEEQGLGLYKRQFDISFNTTYKGMKDVVAYLYADSTAKKIENMSFSFDEGTGLIQGNLTYDQFFLTGTGKPYEDVSIPPIPNGIDNIFGETADRDTIINAIAGMFESLLEDSLTE